MITMASDSGRVDSRLLNPDTLATGSGRVGLCQGSWQGSSTRTRFGIQDKIRGGKVLAFRKL